MDTQTQPPTLGDLAAEVERLRVAASRHSLTRRVMASRLQWSGIAAALLIATAPLVSAALPDLDPVSEGDVLTAALWNDSFQTLVDSTTELEDAVADLRSRQPQIIASSGSGSFTTQSTAPEPIPNCEISVETLGGPVRLELMPADGGLTSWVGGSDPGSGFSTPIHFQRSNDGTTWTDVGAPVAGLGVANANAQLPPSGYTVLDAPESGAWSYRAALSRSGGDGDSSATNVRLVATLFAPPQ